MSTQIGRYPLEGYYREQDELEWGFCLAEGDLGRRSNFGVFIALMEGAGGGRELIDMEAEPERSMHRDLSSGPQRAARRYRRFLEGLRRANGHGATLHTVYGQRAPKGFFGALAPLLPGSALAREAHKRSRSRSDLWTWLERLTSKLQRGTATEDDLKAERLIRWELTDRLREAVRAYRG